MDGGVGRDNLTHEGGASAFCPNKDGPGPGQGLYARRTIVREALRSCPGPIAHLRGVVGAVPPVLPRILTGSPLCIRNAVLHATGRYHQLPSRKDRLRKNDGGGPRSGAPAPRRRSHHHRRHARGTTHGAAGRKLSATCPDIFTGRTTRWPETSRSACRRRRSTWMRCTMQRAGRASSTSLRNCPAGGTRWWGNGASSCRGAAAADRHHAGASSRAVCTRLRRSH